MTGNYCLAPTNYIEFYKNINAYSSLQCGSHTQGHDMTYFAILNHRNCYKLLCASGPSDLFDMFIRVTGLARLCNVAITLKVVRIPTSKVSHVWYILCCIEWFHGQLERLVKLTTLSKFMCVFKIFWVFVLYIYERGIRNHKALYIRQTAIIPCFFSHFMCYMFKTNRHKGKANKAI